MDEGGRGEGRLGRSDFVEEGVGEGESQSWESKPTTIVKEKIYWEYQLTIFLGRFHHHPPAFYIFRTDPPTYKIVSS